MSQWEFGAKNDVVLTSMRRDVASTSIQRNFDTKCPLGVPRYRKKKSEVKNKIFD